MHTPEYMSDEWKMLEFFKCKSSALYFVKNYINTPITGGHVAIKESAQWIYKDDMAFKCLQRYESIILLESRQSGKTTKMAAIALWAITFFPKYRMSFISMSKNLALEVIDRIKFMHSMLPDFLKVPIKGKTDRLTYILLENGSRFQTLYVSAQTAPDQLARGFTQPGLMVDECAFIPHIETIWTAAAPSMSTARMQAKLNGYPPIIVISSTPNGVFGDGEFFYQMWKNSAKLEQLYDKEANTFVSNPDEVLRSGLCNAFVGIFKHWSEIPGKDEAWYADQKRLLNFNKRKIQQELDCIFLSSEKCIFDDTILENLVPMHAVRKTLLPHNTWLQEYLEEYDTGETYIIGVDTASTGTDRSAFSIWAGTDFIQVAQFADKITVIEHYLEIIHAAVLYLLSKNINSSNIKLAIERNSFGIKVCQDLLLEKYNSSITPYEDMVIFTTKKEDESDPIPGIWTDRNTKNIMLDEFTKVILERPDAIKAYDLIAEMHTIERNNSGGFGSRGSNHDDVFMSAMLAAFGRKKLFDTGHIFKGKVNTTYSTSVDTLANMALANIRNIKQEIREIEKRVDYNENGIEQLEDSDIMTFGVGDETFFYA